MYFISEVSSNHAGSIDRCIEFIKVSKEIGCDAVKFQMFKLDDLFSVEARRARPEFELRRAWELPVSFLGPLKEACEEHSIDFSCTPFYLSAVSEMEPYVDFYKIASYELLWLDLLAEVAHTGKRVILSTGMANLDEIDTAVEHLQKNGAKNIELLHCISGYPTPLADCNLAAIETLRNRYKLKVGWSDHSVNPFVVERAINKWEASTIEFHLDLDGAGDEFKTGHCWLPNDMEKVIKTLKSNADIDGSGVKTAAASEMFDRDWRADPSDGLRPLIKTRATL